MAAEVPIAATVNYSLQPAVQFTGENWSVFNAAFSNYARQQGFYGMLGEEGAEEPRENQATWRRLMAQATTELNSGWVSDKVLPVFRHATDDNAHTIWRRMKAHYSNVTDIRQLQLRDKAERYKQQNEPLSQTSMAL